MTTYLLEMLPIDHVFLFIIVCFFSPEILSFTHLFKYARLGNESKCWMKRIVYNYFTAL